MTDNFGCVGTEIFAIDVRPIPDVNISSPNFQFDCPTYPIVKMYATDTDEGLDFQWFMNGSPVGTNSNFYQNNVAANYQVIATDSEGCTAPSNILTIHPCGTPGVCNLPPGPGCPFPIPLDFNIVPTPICNERHYDGIMPPTATPGSQLWVFEHFPSSTIISLDKTYPKAGYEKIIFFADFGGSLCGIAKPDAIVLAADFKQKTACAGQSVEFEDISTFLPPFSITGWAWNFGDPTSGAANISSTKNPAHTFQNPGDFTVKLTVTSSTGCSSVFSKTIKVAAPPTATILDPATNCAGNALRFLATSPTSDISKWDWNFADAASGDLNVATVNPAFHKFENAGNYLVSLKIRNISGCENTVSKPQTVAPNPLGGAIAMLPASGKICEGKSATLTAPPGGTAWLWNTGATANSLIINQKGNFNLTITDGNGCTYSPPDAIVDVLPAPDATVSAVEKNDLGYVIALFPSPFEACQGDDVLLQSTGNGANFTYSWPDGTIGFLDEFSETRGNLLPTGMHNFSVTVTNPTTGCTSTTPPFSVIVNPAPTNVAIVSSLPAPVCGHQNVVLSVQMPSALNVYEWSTGQGGAFLATDEAGLFSVVATNSFGCSATSNTLKILPGAPIESVPSGCHTRCTPDTICFTPPPSAVSWQWFLNGTAIPGPAGKIPNLIATTSGGYTVLITDASGCTAFSKPLSLNLLPGFGSVIGEVFSDANDDQLIDGGDILEAGIPVILFENSVPKDTVLTNQFGRFSFIDQPEKTYKIALDTANLPIGFSPILWTQNVVISGCEDLETLAFLLKICQPPAPTFLNLETCAGKPVFYENQWINGGETVNFMLKNNAGCDSSVTVTVQELPQIAPQTIQFSTCDSVFYNQKWLAASTSESFVLQSTNGCDSLVTAVVNGWPSASSAVNLSACDSVFFNQTWLKTGASQSFIFQTTNGCDSTVTVSVSGLPGQNSTVNLSACAGQNAVFNGTQIPAGQSKIFVFQSINGCDSTVTIAVSTVQPTSSTVNLAACPGSFAVFQNQNIAAGSSKTFILQNAAGCDSTVLVAVAALPTMDFEIATDSACFNKSDGHVFLKNLTGIAPFEFSIDAGQNWQTTDFEKIKSGTATILVRDGNGCILEKTAIIPAIEPISVALSDLILPCDSTQFSFNPQVSGGGNLLFLWENAGGNALGSAKNFTATSPAGFVFSAINRCETVSKPVIAEWDEATIGSLFYAPNVFAPEGENNKNWQVIVKNESQITDYQLVVFDRWGNKVFSTTNPSEVWDGTSRGKKRQPGVYVWMLEGTVEVCGQRRKLSEKGDVTVVR